MTTFLKLSMTMLLCSTLLSGCFGYDRILFVTKTNVGLDVENKPPTAEITVARRELAIAPAFRDNVGKEKTPPLIASFGRTGGLFSPGLNSLFAGGDAAVFLAKKNESSEKSTTDDESLSSKAITTGSVGSGSDPVQNDETSTEDDDSLYSEICLDKKPDSRPPLKKFWHWLFGEGDENTRAFYFATDTTVGIKVGWDGTGGPYPTNLKLGYNRKESAIPPVMTKEGCQDQNPRQPRVVFNDSGHFVLADEEGEPKVDEDGKHTKVVLNENEERVLANEDGTPKLDINKKPIPFNPWYEVKVPSFFASLDNDNSFATPDTSRSRHVQFFATGRAANEFVKKRKLSDAVFKGMAPLDSEEEVAGTNTLARSTGLEQPQ